MKVGGVAPDVAEVTATSIAIPRIPERKRCGSLI